MSQRLPSLNALRAFEASGRHLSFTKAAEELHVTPAAVGQQVKVLEADLGVTLLKRYRRGLVLAEAGRALLPGLGEVFYRLSEVVEEFRRRDSDRPVTISLPPVFAARWLLPRLHRFRELHPDLEVRLDATNRVVDLLREDGDLGIRYGTGDYPGLRVEPLLAEEVFPVCSPALLREPHPLLSPSDLRHHSLLHTEFDATGEYWPDWTMWLASAGIDDINARRGLRVTDTNLAIEAAVKGQGVALGSRVLAGEELAAGRLVRPFAHSWPVTFAYYLVCPDAIADEPRIAAFCEWLIGEAAAEDPLSEDAAPA
jgi:LysR family glycine cleavage system transcriptional activator